MSTPRGRNTDPVLRTAAWFYIAPRVFKLVLIGSAVILAAGMVLTALGQQLFR